MIYESYPWKCYLARQVQALLRRKEQKRWPESSMACVERDVFMCGYALRKLIEAKKLSDEVESVGLDVTMHPWTGKTVDIMSRHDLHLAYDLTQEQRQQMGLREFCNQIVHSFVFQMRFLEAGGLDGIYVASDYSKQQGVYFVEIDEIIRVLELAVEDDICEIITHREKIGGEWKIVRKSNRALSDGEPRRLHRRSARQLGLA